MINERITIRLPEDLIRKLDEIIKAEGFSNRSEYIRKVITDLIKNQGKVKEQDKVIEEKTIESTPAPCDTRSRKITIEISEDAYMLILDMQAQGIFHGPIEYILSNEIERALLRHLRELKEARRKDIEIINSDDSKVVG